MHHAWRPRLSCRSKIKQAGEEVGGGGAGGETLRRTSFVFRSSTLARVTKYQQLITRNRTQEKEKHQNTLQTSEVEDGSPSSPRLPSSSPCVDGNSTSLHASTEATAAAAAAETRTVFSVAITGHQSFGRRPKYVEFEHASVFFPYNTHNTAPPLKFASFGSYDGFFREGTTRGTNHDFRPITRPSIISNQSTVYDGDCTVGDVYESKKKSARFW